MVFKVKLHQQNYTLADNKTYLLFNDTDVDYLNGQYKYFQVNYNSSSWDWILSKGTNFSCFVQYYNGISRESQIDNTISIIRTIIYAAAEPFQSAFFYWTLLLFILHRFNFKKPVMKVILLHFVLRSIGDILDKIGGLMPHYFANSPIKDKNEDIVGYDCFYGTPSAEQHPLKWFITRQIGNTFWYTGEIAADLYPLLRTRAVAKEDKSIWFVYVSCACFNIAKIVLISIHYFLSPAELYGYGKDSGLYTFRRKEINMFYFLYWAVQFTVIMTSLIYDFTVFLVLKKNVFEITQSEFGFLKKFRTISEFRIIVSILICIFLLPVIFVTYIFKYYYYKKYDYNNLNFSFDDVRRLIANVQYFMIFIDQILLLRSREDTSFGENTDISNLDSNKSAFIRNSNIDSKLYYGNLMNLSGRSSVKNNNRNSNSHKINSNTKNSSLDSLPPSGNIRHSQRYSQPGSLMDCSFSGNSCRSLRNSALNLTQRYSHPNSLMEYSFSGDTNINTPSTNTNSNSNTNANINVNSSTSTNTNTKHISINENINHKSGKTDSAKYINRSKSLSNYDDEDISDGLPNEWSFLRR